MDGLDSTDFAKRSGPSGSFRWAWLFLLITSLLWLDRRPAWSAQPPNPAEANAFNAAARAFNGADYDLARRAFAEFIQTYPQSARVPEAVFFQAQASRQLGDTDAAVALLRTNLPNAGGFTEQYLYLLGASHLQASNYLAAASTFSQFVASFPNSQQVVEAIYREALARFRLHEPARVLDLLQNPDGTFQKLSGTRTNNEFVTRGTLLLAEALMQQNQLTNAERNLLAIRTNGLDPGLLWDREFLLCKIQVGQGRLPEALLGTSNLVAIATSATFPLRRAESIDLQAELLERLASFPAAVSVYEQNLRRDLPSAVRREALLKIVNLTLAQENREQAGARLERLILEHPGETGLEMARLGLGELRLKQYFSAPTNILSTNLLNAALVQFEEVAKIPNSALAGKAHLDRGWCLWESARTNESAGAFKTAADQLPHSPEQAVARFKLADALVAGRDFSNAVDHFQMVIDGYRDLPVVRQALLPHAWYNLLRCCIEINDLSRANAAMKEILGNYSETAFAEKSMLLLGQELSRSHRPIDGQAIFRDFVSRFKESPLLPEVALALARSYEQGQQWGSAIAAYDQWIGRYPTNELRPRAEFDRALANYHAQRETNAATLFTNFLARFPNDKLTPLARIWVADFYFRQNDFTNAEANYQLILENSGARLTDLAWQARMMAGRAAYSRQDYRAATNYFLGLVNDKACPPNLAAEAFYALGDTMIVQDTTPGKAAPKTFDEAKEAFRRIIDNYPTNNLVPSAWGRVGDCYLQMASVDVKFYENAVGAYQAAMTHPKADIRVRSLAEFGLGKAFELQARQANSPESEAMFRNAFDHYQAIISGKNLNAAAGEKIDLPCYRMVAIEAARLAEERKQWQVAVNIYKDLIQAVPAIKDSVERKMQRAMEQLTF